MCVSCHGRILSVLFHLSKMDRMEADVKNKTTKTQPKQYATKRSHGYWHIYELERVWFFREVKVIPDCRGSKSDTPWLQPISISISWGVCVCFCFVWFEIFVWVCFFLSWTVFWRLRLKYPDFCVGKLTCTNTGLRGWRHQVITI